MIYFCEMSLSIFCETGTHFLRKGLIRLIQMKKFFEKKM